MPIYEFVCDDCGKGFEKLFRGMTTRSRPTCPHCKSRNVHKTFSTFATQGGDPAKGGGTSCVSCSSGSCSTCGQ